MEVRADKPPIARCLRDRALSSPSFRHVPFLVLGAALLLLGCGSNPKPDPASVSLVAGTRAAPIAPAQLAPAAAIAERFATEYAAAIYERRIPELPAITAGVRQQLEAAATRVPANRRGRQPRAGEMHFNIADRGRIRVDLTVLDSISPPFSIGFTVAERGGRWLVVSVSTPE